MYLQAQKVGELAEIFDMESSMQQLRKLRNDTKVRTSNNNVVYIDENKDNIISCLL